MYVGNSTINAMAQELTNFATSGNSIIRGRFFEMFNGNITNNIYSSKTSMPATVTDGSGRITGTNTAFLSGYNPDYIDKISRNGQANNKATFAADFLSTAYNNGKGRTVSVSSSTFNGFLESTGSMGWIQGNRDSQKPRHDFEPAVKVSKNSMDHAYIENTYRSANNLQVRTFFSDQYFSTNGNQLDMIRLGNFNSVSNIEHYGIYYYTGDHF